MSLFNYEKEPLSSLHLLKKAMEDDLNRTYSSAETFRDAAELYCPANDQKSLLLEMMHRLHDAILQKIKREISLINAEEQSRKR